MKPKAEWTDEDERAMVKLYETRDTPDDGPIINIIELLLLLAAIAGAISLLRLI